MRSESVSPARASPTTSQLEKLPVSDINGLEKQQHNVVVMKYYDDPAIEFIETIRTAAKAGPDLEARLNSIISVSGFKENIANSILNGITNIIKDGIKMGEAMKKAVADATDTAWKFAKEHPYYAALIAAGTIIAIGVLVALAPWVLEALGFAARGPRIASVAARWMSRIAKANKGGVPKGSIYAFLQRLGMTWTAEVYTVSERNDGASLSG